MTDHHFRREDRSARGRRVSASLAAYPEGLDIALENLDRWESWGRTHPAPLVEWRRRILAAKCSPEAFRELLTWLAAANDDSEPLKSCSPFVGLRDENLSDR
jgi:hypothetical protein